MAGDLLCQKESECSLEEGTAGGLLTGGVDSCVAFKPLLDLLPGLHQDTRPCLPRSALPLPAHY